MRPNSFWVAEIGKARGIAEFFPNAVVLLTVPTNCGWYSRLNAAALLFPFLNMSMRVWACESRASHSHTHTKKKPGHNWYGTCFHLSTCQHIMIFFIVAEVFCRNLERNHRLASCSLLNLAAPGQLQMKQVSLVGRVGLWMPVEFWSKRFVDFCFNGLMPASAKRLPITSGFITKKSTGFISGWLFWIDCQLFSFGRHDIKTMLQL